MKKTLVTLAILGMASGAASAASSVTLYGKLDIAYASTLHNADSSGNRIKMTQHGGGESRLGFKVKEDLGNGMAAFAHLEAGFDGTTGQKNGDFFNEKSVVGLSMANGEHSVYFGRSSSPIDRIGFSTDHRSSGLGWKSSAGQYQNGAFYDYSANGLSVMAAVTTKAGLAGNSTEGVSGGKHSYGLSVKYAASNFAIGAGYQKDNAVVSSEWGVGGQYTFNPVTIALSYADAKLADSSKVRRIHSTISAMVTPNDKVFVNYIDAKHSNGGVGKHRQFGLGYVHSLSKRTEVFANVGMGKVSGSMSYGPVSDASTVNVYSKYKAWDIGLRHSF